MKKCIAAAVFAWHVVSCAVASADNFTLLHAFSGDVGSGVESGVIVSGSTLYGTTDYGGDANDGGLLYSVNTDGTGFQILHQFGSGSDGLMPRGSLTSDGSTIYGTTAFGGTAGSGTVFKMNSDGSGYQILHNFAGDANGGILFSGVTVSGSTVYGTTHGGGIGGQGFNGDGTVFKLNSDGTGFQVLHSFAGPDGMTPSGSLVVSGSMVFGTATSGGANNDGVVFEMNADGSGFQVLHTFSAADGAFPVGGLVLSGSTLYGTTESGAGAFGSGTIVSLQTDGSGFQVLHPFAAGPNDGANPQSPLTLVGSTLYGATAYGGVPAFGTDFQINIDGTGFQLLHANFDANADGAMLLGSVAVSGSNVYGTAFDVGPGGAGAVFALSIPEPESLALAACGLLAIIAGALLRPTMRFGQGRRKT
jgi:uncharacterized repeat protein (TIGR03803 family)